MDTPVEAPNVKTDKEETSGLKKSKTDIPQAESITNDSNETLQVTLEYQVRVPKFGCTVAVQQKSIDSIIKLCQSGKKSRFPWAEVSLGVSSLFLGAFFGALIAQTPYQLCLASIFAYNICPILGIGCAVAYAFLRKDETASTQRLAQQVEELLCYAVSD